MSNVPWGKFWFSIICILSTLVLALVGLYFFADPHFRNVLKSIEFFSDTPGLSGLFILTLSPIVFLLLLYGISTVVKLMKKPN